MKTKIKKLIPQPIKDILRPLKKKFYDDAKKRVLFKKMQKKHKQLIEQIKGKEKIKVVFLPIHKSVWKVDPVFKKMLEDPYFEPLILVCPYTAYGKDKMWEDMKDTYEYFQVKGYPVVFSYNKEKNRWILLEDIKHYSKVTKSGGTIIMSGFYESDLPLIKEEAEHQGYQFQRSELDNNWCAALFTKV